MANALDWRAGIAIIALLAIGFAIFSGGVTGSTHLGTLYGKPLSASCTDSDFGWVGSTKGTCTDGTGTYTDGCKDAIRVAEFYCTPSNVCQKWAYACKLGERCVDGACAAK